jgi:hypothetical protein
MTVTVTAPGMRVDPGAMASPVGVHKLGSPAHLGALGDRPPDALTLLAGVLLDLLVDSAASSCRSLPTRLRGRCPRSRDVWHHDYGQPLPALRALSWGLFMYAARQQVWISDQNATTRQGIGAGLWAGDGRDFPRLPSTEHGLRETDGTGGDDQ